MTETTETTVTETQEQPNTTTEEIVVTDNTTTSESTQETTNEVNLFESKENENVDRPEWLPEKFKNPEDLGKSYTELEKKLGAHIGAPEEYEATINEGLEDFAITTDDPFAADFAKVLKDNGVNQKTYNEVANLYFNKIKVEQETIQLAQDEQFKNDCKELGESGIKEVKESIQWAKDILPEDTYNILASVGNKDLTIGKMIKQFHDAYESKNFVRMPDDPSEIIADTDMKEKAMNMMNDEKYGRVASYTKKVDDIYKSLYPD